MWNLALRNELVQNGLQFRVTKCKIIVNIEITKFDDAPSIKFNL